MLEEIIQTANEVVSRAEHVTIKESKVQECISQIKEITLKHWLSSSPYHLLDLPIETIINFLLLYESINFSFWGEPKWTVETKEGIKDGSMALLYVLLQYIKETGNLDFSSMTKEQFAQIVKGNIEIPLFEERYQIITGVSKIVNEKMQGNFYNAIKDKRVDLELFNSIITNFPSFKDEREYKGQTIYFYKLAQLLTSDILHIREQIEGIQVDYSHLVGCSDYKIPQTMRALGIVEYSDELAKIIDREQEIKANSEYEVEIRASMLVVIDKIKKALNYKVKAIDINDYFYIKSRDKEIVCKPYHRVRTTSY